MTDLDLDSIEARANLARLPYTTGATADAIRWLLGTDVPALVAEVRRLRDGARGIEADLDRVGAERDEARAAIDRVRALCDDLRAIGGRTGMWNGPQVADLIQRALDGES